MVTGSLERAVTLLDDASRLSRSAVRTRISRIFDQSSGEQHMQRALSQAELAVRELRSGGGRGEQAADGVQALVDEMRGYIEHRTFAIARLDTPLQYAPGRLAIHRDRVRLLEQVAHLDDAAAQRTFDDSLDGLSTRLLEDPTSADHRTIAALMGMPESIRPTMAGTRLGTRQWEAIGSSPRGHNWTLRNQATPELGARLERRQLAAAPGTTRESLTRELDALLDRDPDSLEFDELRRASLIVGMPDRLRPAAADVRMAYGLYHPSVFASDPSVRGNIMVFGGNLKMMKIEREIEAMRAAGTLPTRDAALAELDTLLAAPSEAITDPQLRRITQLTRMSADIGLPLPPQTRSVSIEDAGAQTFWGAMLSNRAALLDDTREFYAVLRAPDEAIRDARAAIDAGEAIDLVKFSALQHLPERLEAAGITQQVLGEQLARQLNRAGSTDMRTIDLRWAIDSTRARVVAHELPDELEPLRTQALELIDRNTARMDGLRHDTYSYHPDYAEVGRVASLAQVLDAAATTRPAPAAGVAETLAW